MGGFSSAGPRAERLTVQGLPGDAAWAMARIQDPLSRPAAGDREARTAGATPEKHDEVVRVTE